MATTACNPRMCRLPDANECTLLAQRRMNAFAAPTTPSSWPAPSLHHARMGPASPPSVAACISIRLHICSPYVAMQMHQMQPKKKAMIINPPGTMMIYECLSNCAMCTHLSAIVMHTPPRSVAFYAPPANGLDPSPDVFDKKHYTLSPRRCSHAIPSAGSVQIFSCWSIRLCVLGSSNNTKYLPKDGSGASYSPFSSS